MRTSNAHYNYNGICEHRSNAQHNICPFDVICEPTYVQLSFGDTCSHRPTAVNVLDAVHMCHATPIAQRVWVWVCPAWTTIHHLCVCYHVCHIEAQHVHANCTLRCYVYYTVHYSNVTTTRACVPLRGTVICVATAHTRGVIWPRSDCRCHLVTPITYRRCVHRPQSICWYPIYGPFWTSNVLNAVFIWHATPIAQRVWVRQTCPRVVSRGACAC